MADYTVIIGAGYCEDSHPARLILNFFNDTDKQLTAKELAKEFFDLLCEYVKQDIPDPRPCCKKAKKSDNFCAKCGMRLLHELDRLDMKVDRVGDLFHSLITDTQDGIANACRGHENLYEFMYENGWEQNGIPQSGYIAEITSFDRYIQNPENKCSEFREGAITIEGFGRDY